MRRVARKGSNSKNFVFYDFETTGVNLRYSQVTQVGAALMDPDWKELDKFSLRCRLRPGVLPQPEALVITKTRLTDLLNEPMSHLHLVQTLEKKFRQWSPSIFMGYNSLHFDEEVLRSALFENLLNPFLTVSGRNGRIDVFKLLECALVLNPDVVKTEKLSSGRRVLRLSSVSKSNDIIHTHAHDALSDVLATSGVCKLLKENSEIVWNAALQTMSKKDAARVIESYIEAKEFFCFSVKSKIYAAEPIAIYPASFGGRWLTFDLQFDPEPYLHLSPQEISAQLSLKPSSSQPIVFRACAVNASPILLPKTVAQQLAPYSDIPMEVLEERAERIRRAKKFRENVAEALKGEEQKRKEYFGQPTTMEERMYEKMTVPQDHLIMEKFHSLSWSKRAPLLSELSDDRLQYFGARLLFEHYPAGLSPSQYALVEKSIGERLMTPAKANWETIHSTLQIIEVMKDLIKSYPEPPTTPIPLPPREEQEKEQDPTAKLRNQLMSRMHKWDLNPQTDLHILNELEDFCYQLKDKYKKYAPPGHQK